MNINLASTSDTAIFLVLSVMYTLKTGTPNEDGDPILKLLQGVFCPAIHYSELGWKDGYSILKSLQRVSLSEIQSGVGFFSWPK